MKKIMGFLAIFFMIHRHLLAAYPPHDDSDHKHYTAEEIMDIAMSAAPENVSGNAPIMGSEGTILKEGVNGWV
ncbi:MAG: hypothetical protein Ct9H300mP6_08150 [Gammaproteobacteria bacterium]|nr:MAG: hypothetical protein Ct9H300mP6_08150 [Gammaproteobacteria bacterium]